MKQSCFGKKLSESQLQKQIVSVLMYRGWLVIRINSGVTKIQNRFIRNYFIYNTKKSAGLPDLIAFKGPRTIFIEVKKHNAKPSESQKEFFLLAEKYKLEIYLINNLDQMELIT